MNYCKHYYLSQLGITSTAAIKNILYVLPNVNTSQLGGYSIALKKRIIWLKEQMWLDSLLNIALTLAAGVLDITLQVWNGVTIDAMIKDCYSGYGPGGGIIPSALPNIKSEPIISFTTDKTETIVSTVSPPSVSYRLKLVSGNTPEEGNLMIDRMYVCENIVVG